LGQGTLTFDFSYKGEGKVNGENKQRHYPFY